MPKSDQWLIKPTDANEWRSGVLGSGLGGRYSDDSDRLTLANRRRRHQHEHRSGPLGDDLLHTPAVKSVM